jgi:hypothetical protein
VITKPANVTYKKPTSDINLQIVAERVSQLLGRNVIVHSGDRDYRPKGSPAKSLHLSHRAIDLHIPNLPDSRVFNELKKHRAEIFASIVESYQVIHHGPHTETEAEHIHIGHYHLIKSVLTGPGVSFFTEGMTTKGKGHYSKVFV